MDKSSILHTLTKIRFIFNDVSFAEEEILLKLRSYLPSTDMVFPCDVIDLRQILKTEYINFDGYIPLFSQKFADQFLKQFSLFLIIDVRKIEIDSFKYGGLCIVRTNKLNVKKSLKRIIVNKPSSDETYSIVQNIMKDLKKRVDCVVSNSIPGISGPSFMLSAQHKEAQQKNNMQITLTPKEKNIIDFLRTVKKDHNLHVQMRIIGGWTRDKLMGKQSDDIDIAVDMPGYDLAQIVAKAAVDYNVTHDPKAYRVSLEKSADPLERVPSDDLMVGAVYLFGQKIEFVPMRTEYYPDPNRRQPSITPTTDPRKDSLRRDLTINALYYNIDTQQIEDFVGGIRDLGTETGKMYLRTPESDSKKTFVEDPLRMLRVLRFYSKYPNSEIDEKIKQSMIDPEVQEAYNRKVSTERAGPEIIKMLEGENPVNALALLFKSGLYKNVFKFPEMDNLHPDGIMMDQKTPYHKFNLMDHTLEVVKNMNNLMKEKGENDEMRGLMNLAALFHDFGKMKEERQTIHPKNPNQIQYIGHEIDSAKMANSIMKSIGIGKEDRDIVNQIIRLHMRPHSAEEWGPKGRGKFLRETRMHGKEEEHKDLWKYVFYHAQADSMASDPEKYNEEKTQQIFKGFEQFVKSPIGQFKGTIINGNDIMSLFPQIKPSTGYISEVLNYVKELQDNGQINVSGDKETAKQQAIEEVKKIVPVILNKYKGSSMNINWYKNIKFSQILPIETNSILQDKEIKKGPSPMIPKYRKGMRVRDRRKGIANPQEFGVIDSINGDMVKIIWNPENKGKRREEKYDMIEDTEKLSLIVAEI